MKYLPDVIALCGLGLLGYGLYLYEPWVAFAVCGALLIVAGVAIGKGEER